MRGLEESGDPIGEVSRPTGAEEESLKARKSVEYESNSSALEEASELEKEVEFSVVLSSSGSIASPDRSK